MANDEELALVEPGPAPPEDIMVCAVCYEVYHKTKRPPRLFPCGHTFCQPCINSVCLSTPMARFNGVSCATCRRVTKIENWNDPTATFAPNYTVMNFLEKYEDSEHNKSFACFHCKVQFHEKLMTFCETCYSKQDFYYSERDFLGRPNTRLMCGGCANIHHVGVGHSFASLPNVNGRWNYRTLYRSCSKAAEKQNSQIDDIISAFEKGIEVARQYKTNLNETVRQMESHASQRSNRTVLRNFMKNSVKCSALFASIRESAERLSEPNLTENRMLGSALFPSASETNRTDARVSDTTQYRRTLRDLFTRHHNSNNRNDRGSVETDRAGPSQRTPPVAQAEAAPRVNQIPLPAPRVNQIPLPAPLPQGPPVPPIRMAPAPVQQFGPVPAPAQQFGPVPAIAPYFAQVPVAAPQFHLFPAQGAHFPPVPAAPRINLADPNVLDPLVRNFGLENHRDFLQEMAVQFLNLDAPDGFLQRQQDIPQNEVQAVPNVPEADYLEPYRMLLQVQPALFEQRVAHNFEMELPLLFQPRMIPPVTPFTEAQLDVILDYFFHANDEERATIVRNNQYNPLTTFEDLAAARRRTRRLAVTNAPPPRRPDRIVMFYTIPFHFFNASLTSLYSRGLGEVILNFIICIDQGRREVYDFFFLEPNGQENNNVEARTSIKSVLMSLMIILIPGQFPYTYFERELQLMENEERDRNFRAVEANNIDAIDAAIEEIREVRPPVVIVPVQREQEVIVIDDADASDDEVDSGSEDDHEVGDDDDDEIDSGNEGDDDEARAESDSDIEIESEDGEDGDEDESDDEDPVIIQENMRPEEIVRLNEDPDIEEIPAQRRRVGRPRIETPPREQRDQEVAVVEPNNDVVRDLQRQDRHNFVFQVADLLPEPPARATRAAKRRAHEEPAGIPRASPEPQVVDPEPEPVRRGRGRPRKHPRVDSVAPPPTRKSRPN